MSARRTLLVKEGLSKITSRKTLKIKGEYKKLEIKMIKAKKKNGVSEQTPCIGF